MRFSRFIAFSLTLLLSNIAEPSFAQSASVHGIIQAWRHAVGKSPRVGTLRQRYAAEEDQVPGTVDQWITASGSMRRSTVSEFDGNELLVTPAIAQTRDWNGFVRYLDGTELARVRSETFIAAALAFGPPAVMERARLTATLQPHCVALIFTPSHGISIKWVIDQDTSLPIQTIIRGNEAELTAAYRDWQLSGGVFTPQHIVVSEQGKPDSDYRLAPLQFHPASAFTFSRLRQNGSDVIMAAPSVKLPFTLEANHIILQAQVNGHVPIGFLVDTGDGHESINTARAAAFGLSSYGSTASYGGGNLAQLSLASGVTFTFHGIELHSQHVDLLDQTGLEKALGLPLGGILGYDFLCRFIVEIDYEAKIMTLHKASAWHYTGHGTVVPITFDGGIPYFEAQIAVPTQPVIPAHLCMDFGAADTMTFNSPFVRDHNLIQLAGTDTRVLKAAGLENEFFAQSNMRGHIDEFRLGGLVAHNIPVSLSANTSGAYSDDSFAGTVGEGIYTRYHVFLDYPRHRAVFEPTAKTSEPFPERKTYGLTLIAEGDDLHSFLVTAIRSESPAAKAGFLKGDIISGFDDRPAAGFTLAQLRDTLLREGETHDFRILRAGNQASIHATVAVVSIDQKPSTQHSDAAASSPPALVGSLRAHPDWPAANKPSSVDTVNHLVASLYEVISGPAGPRDWDRFRSLFLPDGRLGVVITDSSSTQKAAARKEDAVFLTPDIYAQRNDSYFKAHGFFERSIANRIEEFGNLVQVWSTYESRHSADDAKPFTRGINSIQIVHAEGRYWLASVIWDDERPGLTLPDSYLE